MPITEAATVYMEKNSKHDATTTTTTAATPTSSGTNNTNNSNQRETKNASPVFLVPPKKNASPLYKNLGQNWNHVLEFDKVLKQIKSAERYYLRGKSEKGNSTNKFRRRVQPQVQRLNAGDMHFYGIVPKKPFDVVVCDICLGIYTKMGFNNHMKLHHHQAWSSVSSKAAHSKEAYYQDYYRGRFASGNPLANSLARAIPTASSSASNSRHKSSKSGSSGGSSRSKSKSKHHHHHHTQHATSSTSNVRRVTSSITSQATAPSAEMPQPTSSSKSSKKSSSSLNNTSINTSNSENKNKNTIVISKENPFVAPVAVAPTTTSNSSNSQAVTSKLNNSENIALTEATPVPPTVFVGKEIKSKSSKRKSKNSSSTTQATNVAPENNELPNSSIEFTSIAAAAPVNAAMNPPPAAKSSKRSSKAKGGKDLKQLLEPQLSELDQAVSSITVGQIDVANPNSNDHEDIVVANTANVANTTNSIGFNVVDGNSIPITAEQISFNNTRQAQQQQQQQQLPETFNSMPILQEGNNHISQPSQLQQQNSHDNDTSMLTLDDMLDSKFIHEILNTDETEIHFDESELDKAATVAQQQQQQPYMQPTVSKRMRYDEQIPSNMMNTENDEQQQQTGITGKFAAFQQQQQQHQQQQQAFHVTNLEDIKMYTTAMDGQQYLTTSHQIDHQQQTPDQHQITTIDTMHLQQLLYQQQQQQGLNAYTVDDTLEQQQQQQQQYNNPDVIMCSAEQLHKEGKINAADYATLTALNNHDSYNNIGGNNMCDVNAMAASAAAAAAAAQFQIYNVPSLTDDIEIENIAKGMEQKLNDVIVPQQNHYVLPATDGNDEEQLIYEITANNQVAIISQQRQQQMIAEFLTQAGYDNVDNVNINTNIENGNGIIHAEPVETKPIINSNNNNFIDNSNDLLDFDFSRIETVTSVSSSSSSSEHKNNIKNESRSDKYISSSTLPDDMFLNVFVYAGSPRPLALNTFGLVKLPQSVATTFRKNLHATRKANNACQFSLSGSGSPAVISRFGNPNISNVKSSAQNYFTALGGNMNTTSGGGATGSNLNDFSTIGSITITNQTPNNNNTSTNNSTLQQQQQLATSAQKQEFQLNANTNSNGLITAATNVTSPSTHNCNSRSSRPKSAGSNSSSNSTNSHSKNKQSNHSSSSSSVNAAFNLPQNQPKTIFVNTNFSSATAASNTDKFIKRSFISKVNSPPARAAMNISTKQLSDILLHPGKDNKEKLLLLTSTTRDHDAKDANNTTATTDQQQQRLNHVKNFYERRKKLLNATAHAASSTSGGFNQARQLSSTQLNSSNSSSTALKQRLLTLRLLRTLSDCGINSIKSQNSPNSGSNTRVLA